MLTASVHDVAEGPPAPSIQLDELFHSFFLAFSRLSSFAGKEDLTMYLKTLCHLYIRRFSRSVFDFCIVEATLQLFPTLFGIICARLVASLHAIGGVISGTQATSKCKVASKRL